MERRNSLQPTYTARLKSGLIIHEDDILDTCGTFPIVLEACNNKNLESFLVEVEGFSSELNFVKGYFRVGDNYSKLPDDARIIFYKHMFMESHKGKYGCEYIVLGWQITNKNVTPWKNERLGVKLYPHRKYFEVTSEI